MSLPRQIISRKEEITAEFLALMEEHMQQLLQNKAETRYCATDFAKLLFINSRHLTNTIKLTTGKSPCDFMEERITGEAQKMLLQTDLSVADIASRFAYNDPTNFIKFFKGMTGCTPLQFRKQHK